MGLRKHLGVALVSITVACGLDATGEIATNLDSSVPLLDADIRAEATPTEPAKHDASTSSHGADATVAPDATMEGGSPTVDAGHEAGADAKPDTDSGTPDGSHPDAHLHDAAKGDAHGADASMPHDAHEDSVSHEAGDHDSGHHDAAEPKDSGVDASPPPSNCGIFGYPCGSNTCSCNQLCDDGTTCGACVPHYGTCLTACDTDFSSPSSCGGCLNDCYVSCLSLDPSCNVSGDNYTCGC